MIYKNVEKAKTLNVRGFKIKRKSDEITEKHIIFFICSAIYRRNQHFICLHDRKNSITSSTSRRSLISPFQICFPKIHGNIHIEYS